MTRDPFLDQPIAGELEELDGLELEGCASVLLALFGMLSVVLAAAALVEALR